jgi:hypothetical protein
MKTKNALIAVTLLLSIGFTSCKKGDTGEPGKDGKDGNANVTSMTLTASSWIWSAPDYWRYNTWSSVSILTVDVCNTGAVMLYQNSGGSYTALPVTQNIGSKVEHDWFQYSVGSVIIVIENDDLSDPIAQIPTPTTYKLVCIPQKMMQAHPEVDLLNYEQVRTTFDVK